MNRLHQLIISEDPHVDDMLFARELAISVIVEENKPQGLPSHMWESAKECAEDFLNEGAWILHLWLCLLLVQTRHHLMPKPEIVARVEMEHLLMNILFGKWDGT